MKDGKSRTGNRIFLHPVGHKHPVGQASHPQELEELKQLRAGDFVLLSGKFISARDRTFRKFFSKPQAGVLKSRAVYYCGPVIRKGRIVSAGPTTSSRMDWAIPDLLSYGVTVFIGKGVIGAGVMKRKAVYLEAPGGCGALVASKIKSFKIISYPELGPQAMMEFEVKNFPALVGIDWYGGSIYKR